MLLPLLLLLQSVDGAGAPVWMRFARDGALSRRGDTVEVATNGRADGVLQYKLRLTRRYLGRVEAQRWADSRSCPAVREMLTAMEALRMPQPDAPGIGSDDLEVIADGAGYALDAPSSDSNGRLALRSNVGSPLAAWIDRSLAALEPCWTAAEPPGLR